MFKLKNVMFIVCSMCAQCVCAQCMVCVHSVCFVFSVLVCVHSVWYVCTVCGVCSQCVLCVLSVCTCRRMWWFELMSAVSLSLRRRVHWGRVSQLNPKLTKTLPHTLPPPSLCWDSRWAATLHPAFTCGFNIFIKFKWTLDSWSTVPSLFYSLPISGPLPLFLCCLWLFSDPSEAQ